MNIVRRTLDIETDTRLREMADQRGQDVAAVLAEAVALLDSVVDIAGPDISEDRRRLDAYRKTRTAVPLDDVKSWVASWGSASSRRAPRRAQDDEELDLILRSHAQRGVSKEGRESNGCVHPSRLLLRKLLRMRSEITATPLLPSS